ncbi:DegT/DnrJ/EryC1/StrS family aminotransferase [Schleiferiaceae bacterium]|nr:DegT/DnrJ/EryC1/StrS family aminotransferase [Schleiferiaceae bacterium]
MQYKLATTTWDNKEIEAIQKVIDSNVYSMSKYVEQYESEFASHFGSKYAVMTSSGSTANLIMTAALFFRKENNLQRGDEIIVPAVSWSTTYFPLQQYGLKVKFVDIDLETLNYDLVALEEAISNATKAIMIVNLLGNPNDFNEINRIIGDREILVLEDNCESMGAIYQGKQCGTFGLMGSFSSFFSHHIATMEGGMVVTDDEECYHLLLALRAHGWTRNLPDKNHVANKSGNWFEESFRFVIPGYNVRPLEMSGAIGIEQLKKLPDFIEQRRNNAKIFDEIFKNDDRFFLQKEIGTSSWFGFSFIIKQSSGLNRSKILKILNRANIEYRPIVTGDFTKSESLQYFDYEVHKGVHNARYLDAHGFFVGNSHDDLSRQIKYLKETLS